MSAKIFRFPPRRLVIDILRMELDGKLPSASAAQP
jgi:hypothetical protein